MPAGVLTESIQSNKKAEWSDFLHIVGEVKQPFLALLKGQKKPAQKILHWATAELDESGGFEGELDNAAVTDYGHALRGNLSTVAQWIRKPWRVSHFADITEAYGIADERNYQKMKAQARLRNAIEQAFLSAQDCAEEDGETPNRLRGVGSWLAASGHNASFPIAADLRVTTDCIYSGALADFDESDLTTMLQAAAILRDSAVTLDAFVGPALKAKMSDWGAHDPNATTTNAALRVFNSNAADGEFLNTIDVFKFDAGMVRAHQSYHLFRDRVAGARTATISNGGGYFLDMSRWAVRFLDKINSDTLGNDGGGKSGYYHATPALVCGVPAGQCMVAPSS